MRTRNVQGSVRWWLGAQIASSSKSRSAVSEIFAPLNSLTVRRLRIVCLSGSYVDVSCSAVFTNLSFT